MALTTGSLPDLPGDSPPVSFNEGPGNDLQTETEEIRVHIGDILVRAKVIHLKVLLNHYLIDSSFSFKSESS